MAKPLATISAIWDKGSKARYPETVRVPMDDGHVITYRIDIEQPHPQFLNAMELLKKLPVYGGYKYKGPEDKKRRRCL